MSNTKRFLDWIMWKKRPFQHAYTRQQIEDNPGEFTSASCLACGAHEFRDYPPMSIPARCSECGAFMADTTEDHHRPPEK